MNREGSESYQQPEMYAVTLEVNGEATLGWVDPKTYEALKANDRVQVHFKRTRFSKQMLVTEVKPLP